MAAAEVAKYRNATMKATAHVKEKDFAAILEKRREYAGRYLNVVPLPKALPHPTS